MIIKKRMRKTMSDRPDRPVNGKSVKQNAETFSVPRENFQKMVVFNDNLDYFDLKVLVFLLTELGSFNPKNKSISALSNDPMNFKPVRAGSIAKVLNISKKDAKSAIKHLNKLGIIEEGKSYSSKDGYRFTF